jgi:hypothetical protein
MAEDREKNPGPITGLPVRKAGRYQSGRCIIEPVYKRQTQRKENTKNDEWVHTGHGEIYLLR